MVRPPMKSSAPIRLGKGEGGIPHTRCIPLPPGASQCEVAGPAKGVLARPSPQELGNPSTRGVPAPGPRPCLRDLDPPSCRRWITTRGAFKPPMDPQGPLATNLFDWMRLVLDLGRSSNRPSTKGPSRPLRSLTSLSPLDPEQGISPLRPDPDCASGRATEAASRYTHKFGLQMIDWRRLNGPHAVHNGWHTGWGRP